MLNVPAPCQLRLVGEAEERICIPLSGVAALKVIVPAFETSPDNVTLLSVSFLHTLVASDRSTAPVTRATSCISSPSVIVSVPFMVWLAATAHCISPADADAVNVRLLNVFAPVMECETAVVPVKETLLKDMPPPAKVMPVNDDMFICEVFAFNVKFVDVVKAIGDVVLSDIVLLPNVIVLILELLEDKAPAVTL